MRSSLQETPLKSTTKSMALLSIILKIDGISCRFLACQFFKILIKSTAC
ncbi:hypothetical protein Ahy_A04g018925 isoform C [Arachis hypogaea]|uniref:Uncharacterized protein n=1 Tax=Arachis hypogaea TaxID=3818 RepID=A0A445DEZ3_ARAHY|nr:hypothetical protein Ahy_A04g018925 isoform C [Arachis hypogaea]